MKDAPGMLGQEPYWAMWMETNRFGLAFIKVMNSLDKFLK